MLSCQAVSNTLKHHRSPSVSAIQAQNSYQNFGTLHSGMLRVSEPGVSGNNCNRSLTLQNPKRKAQVGHSAFSTLECDKRSRGPVTYCPASAV